MSDYNNLDTAKAGFYYGISGYKTVESWRAGEKIDFGDAVFTYEGKDYSAGGNGVAYKAKQDTSTITLDADLVTSNVITTTITIDGVAQSAIATTFASDHDTTMAAHETAIEAAISGMAVTLTDATNNRQFTLIYQGGNINLITSVVTAGGSQAGVTIAYTNSQIFVGFAGFTHISEVDNVGSYTAGMVVNVLTYGQIWATAAAAVNANVDAYVIWATTNQGLVTSTATDNYAINCKIRNTLASAGLVLVEVRGMQTDATP